MNKPADPAGLFPALLKHWRRQRGLSQLDLALVADVSSRHVSFLETGRSRPSPEMVLRLAAALGVSLRRTNEMLRAAGHTAAYDESTDDLPDMVAAAVELMGAHHEPFPMLVVDRCYRIRHANDGGRRLLTAVVGDVPVDQVNLASVTFDPHGAQPFLVNFDVVGRELLWRIQRELLEAGDDHDLRRLLDELLAMPTVDPDWRHVDLSAASDPVLTVHLRREGVDLRFVVAVTSFSAPQNVAVEELRVETWFPADEATAEACEVLADVGS